MFSTAPLTAFMDLSTAFSVRAASSSARFSPEPDHAVLCAQRSTTVVGLINFRGIFGAFQLYFFMSDQILERTRTSSAVP